MNSFPVGVHRRSPLSRYGFAVACALLAGAVRLSLAPLLGVNLPLVPFYPAVIAAAWFGGLWPGVVSTVISGVIADYLWLEPVHALSILNPSDRIAFISFIALGILVSALNESLHRARARERAARERVEQADEIIRVSQQRVTALIESVPGVVWEAWGQPNVANQRINFVSSYVQTMLGHSVEEWLRTPNFWLSIVHPDDRERAGLAAAASFAGGGSHADQFRWMAKDGSARWVEARAVVVRDESGQPAGMRGVTFDITERKRAEEALRARDAEMELVINQTPFMFTRCSRDLRYQFVSRACAEMLGRRPEDIVGKPIADVIGPQAFATIRPHIDTVLQGTQVEFENEVHYEGVGLRSVHVVYTPDIDEHGRVDGWIASIFDLSERKRAETERAQLLQAERQARAQAEAANRIKDEFLATISHELRTPLNAILGWAVMLERGTASEASTIKGLQSIHRNTRMLAQLVEDVLDVSRMIGGKMRLETSSTDFGDVIDAAVEAVLPAANAKNLSIHVELDPAARSITADATRLQQVVWNFLSNAVKFTPSGGQVDVSTRVHDGEIELTVTDTGIGIDPSFLPYVFERFRQADASSTRAHSGLGLGLAIARHLVELHGGTVSADSAGRGAGARFVVRLPGRLLVTKARPEQVPAAGVAAEGAAAAAPRIDGFRVLIVDDDSESCEVMRESLHENGASTFAAPSAREAISALRRFRPDVVLSDLAMPDGDGYTVLAGVRAFGAELGRHVPIAAVTAYARAEDRERALAAGFDDYLAKPVDPSALATVVATLGNPANRPA